MDRFILILALGLCLAACSANKVDDRLSKLVGQNIGEASARLGPPDGQPTAKDGDKLYVWTTNENATAHTQYSQVSGAMVGSSQGSESVTRADVVHLDCKMELATDQNDRIKSYQWSGDRYCLKYYSDLLKPPSNYSCDKITNVRVHSVCY